MYKVYRSYYSIGVGTQILFRYMEKNYIAHILKSNKNDWTIIRIEQLPFD